MILCDRIADMHKGTGASTIFADPDSRIRMFLVNAVDPGAEVSRFRLIPAVIAVDRLEICEICDKILGIGHCGARRQPRLIFLLGQGVELR